MAVTTHRALPAEIAEIQHRMEEIAASYGLDFFETIFEMLDYEELSMFAAYGGFPIRYPHWRFGAEYDELLKSYSYGLSKIYEMVINTDPCYAYLLSANAIGDQKLVIAHVYGHCDFFKNNAWFAPTNRKMLDQMANHAARVNRYIDRYGYEPVERFIDACLSIDNLIDPYSPHIQRKATPKHERSEAKNSKDSTDEEQRGKGRFRAKEYMESFINPPDVLEREQRLAEEKKESQAATSSFPEKPQRDVLQFLLDHAPLEQWQHDVLAIIRDEAYYFAPQGQTKIMNEGWASYWHSTIMTRHGLTDAEVIDYADHHSGTMAMSPQRLNPYKIGIELFRDIEERWNKGKFGDEWENCDNMEEKKNWDKELGLGRDKIFEVRQVHNDLTFIDTFLNAEFCRRHKMFAFAYNDRSGDYEIASREFDEIKKQLLTSLTNHGRPFIYVIDGNHRNRGELYLKHEYQGIELKQDYANATLANLQQLWRRPVHLETVIDDELSAISYDGHTHSVSRIDR
ncbi:SpoVR family protein [Thalassoglobus polymorphus]|uniref:SpoVR family protein n=1 Tax=Thalassoglobus polymorphus TaxID=2527994 RepID=A0A517QLX9_9PLAN|nr:SpoVR family protein [Thalassoglobus polymorphus]QDT32557.1 SpoVR family protein [Thalassoglobus polymorphus]